MKNVTICIHRMDGIWIAHEELMRTDANGKGNSPLSALMNLLPQLEENPFELEELHLVGTEDRKDESQIYLVTLRTYRKTPMPSLN